MDPEWSGRFGATIHWQSTDYPQTGVRAWAVSVPACGATFTREHGVPELLLWNEMLVQGAFFAVVALLALGGLRSRAGCSLARVRQRHPKLAESERQGDSTDQNEGAFSVSQC